MKKLFRKIYAFLVGDFFEPKEKGYPCPHGRYPIAGEDGWKRCPNCLGLNR